MSIGAISDPTLGALQFALNSLEARQKANAANIANVETPGYLAKQVSFEDSLRSAMNSGDPTSAEVSVNQSLAPTRMNGNNVNIDFELMAQQETLLRQRLLAQAVGNKFALLRTAITGQ
jgi:flagellar basal-body rod protein FlgB